MPRDARQTHRKILQAAYRQFRRKGFSRVSVDEIAAAARVTKRTLYSHFRSKDELMAAAFEAQVELADVAKRDAIDSLTGSTPAQLVESLFTQHEARSSKPRWAGSGFTRLAMELADLPGHPARVLARRHKRILETLLAKRLEKAGVQSSAERAREILMLSEGAMAMILIHGDPSYATAAAQAAKQLISLKGR
jgi:AcrR family transcriptional regulator